MFHSRLPALMQRFYTHRNRNCWPYIRTRADDPHWTFVYPLICHARVHVGVWLYARSLDKGTPHTHLINPTQRGAAVKISTRCLRVRQMNLMPEKTACSPSQRVFCGYPGLICIVQARAEGFEPSRHLNAGM